MFHLLKKSILLPMYKIGQTCFGVKEKYRKRTIHVQNQ
ncbi:hypothetical protein CHCC20335_4305 [Bacillus paralicheniformis]|nr:hypothetical protein CHCC20335_4305 [Bacillus paralicheniformis]